VRRLLLAIRFLFVALAIGAVVFMWWVLRTRSELAHARAAHERRPDWWLENDPIHATRSEALWGMVVTGDGRGVLAVRGSSEIDEWRIEDLAWGAPPRRVVHSLGYSTWSEIDGFVLSADGRFLWAETSISRVLIDLETGVLTPRDRRERIVALLDGGARAIASEDLDEQGAFSARLITLDMKTGTSRQLWHANDFIQSISVAPTAHVLAAATAHGSVTLIDIGSGAVLREIEPHDFVDDVALPARGPTVVLCWCARDEESSRAALWQTDGRYEPLDTRGRELMTAALSPDGETAVAVTRPGTLLVWDTASATLLREVRLPREDGEATTLAFASEGRLLVGTRLGHITVHSIR
jgi:hypothetical protein